MHMLTEALQKEIGAWNFLQINEGLEGLSMLTFINMGYSKEEVEVMCAKMRAEFKNPKIHTLFHLYVIGLWLDRYLWKEVAACTDGI